MQDKQEIILKYVREGRSKRSISLETGYDWKTVDKYIREYEASLEEKSGVDGR